MKRILLIILLFFSLFACKKSLNNKTIQSEEITIEQNKITIIKDTFNISMNARLESVALFEEEFYCMFESNKKNDKEYLKKMLVLNSKGEFIRNISIPEEIHDMIYYNFKTKNDSLYIKRTQFEKENFVLEKSISEFKLKPNMNFKDYEDENYNIYSICNGEFGGTLYFEDKETKNIYEAPSTCPIAINKIENTYYITNVLDHLMTSISVTKILDPKKLQKSKLEFEKRTGSRSILGFEQILDTYDFYMITSFMLNNKLLHLYLNEEGTFLGEINKNKLRPLHKFDFIFYAQTNQSNLSNKQVLRFNIPETDGNGILLIENDTLSFHFIK